MESQVDVRSLTGTTPVEQGTAHALTAGLQGGDIVIVIVLKQGEKQLVSGGAYQRPAGEDARDRHV
jgi:hypothetical protein